MRLSFLLRRNGAHLAREFPDSCSVEVCRAPQDGALSVQEIEPGRFKVLAGVPTLSERHLSLLLDGEHASAVDSSSNGTFLRLQRGARSPVDASELSLAGELTIRVGAGDNEPVISATSIAELRPQLEDGLRTLGFAGRLQSGRAPLARPARALWLGGEHFLWLEWTASTLDERIERWLTRAVSEFHLNASLASENTPSRAFAFQAASAERKAALDLGRRVAASTTNMPALFLGRQGAGKERLARAICENSRCYRAPVLLLDAGAVVPERIEVELFGDTRPGLLERAHGGTLLLADIEKIPPVVQAKLVAFLERGTFSRVGETPEHHANVRLFALAQPSLLDRLDQGGFRPDLYYRLARVVIRVPRPRAEDIREIVRDEVQWGEDGPLPAAEVEKIASIAAASSWKGGARELTEALARYLTVFRDPARPEESFRLAIENARLDTDTPPAPRPTSGLAFEPAQVEPTCEALFGLHFLLAARQATDVRALGTVFGKSHQWARDQLASLGLTSKDLRDRARLDARIGELRASLARSLPALLVGVQRD